MPPAGGVPRASPSAAPPTGTVTIVAVGDTMLGNTPNLPASPQTYFRSVRATLHGPIVFGNLEGTLTSGRYSKCPPPTPSPAPTGSPTGASPSASPSPARVCYAFRVPPSYASSLRHAGFTILNNANNHSADFGSTGLSDTLRALRSASIAHTGLPGQIAVLREGRLRVAFLGFAPYSATASLLDLPAAGALIRAARLRADLVVVYMHAGAEGSSAVHVTGQEEAYAGEDRGNPEAFAHMAVRAGADLVIASGPHVLRGLEFYRGHLIAYSLGNFAGYDNFSTEGTLGVSCVLRVKLGGDGRFISGRIVSLRLNSDGRPVMDPSRAGARLIARLSKEDFGRRAARVAGNAVILPPRGSSD